MYRRDILTVIGLLTVTSLGGCLGGDGDGSDPDNNNTSATDDSTDPNDGTDPNVPEVDASFTVEPREPTVGDTVTLDASRSDGEIVEYRWTISDSEEFTTETAATTYTFGDPGTHTVTLQVVGAEGRTDETSLDVTVAEQTNGDIGEILVEFEFEPENADPGEEILFDATQSETSRPGASLAEFRWDFDGDGTFEQTTTDPTTAYTFDEVGRQEVTLEVTDSGGTAASASRSVTVGEASNRLFAAFTRDPVEPEVDETTTFDASDSGGNIVEYRWDFDDDGTFEQTTTEPVTTRAFDESGGRSVTLEVETADGFVETVTNAMFVSPEYVPPSAAFGISPEEPDVGEEVTLDAEFSTGDIVEYRWDFDDDGTFEQTTTEPVTTHIFNESRARVTLEIEDVEGETDRSSIGFPLVPPVTVTLGFAPRNPGVDEEVTFEASVPDADIAEYRWDFDDDETFEQTTTDPVATYSFDETGAKSVTLEVLTSDGETTAVSRIVNVVAGTFEWTPEQPVVGEQVTFEASVPDADIAEYRWDFDDDETFEQTTTDPVATYSFDETGAKSVTLEVLTSDDRTGSLTRSVEVVPDER